jgi:transcriptional regulator with XRE-family HTH domain
MSHPHFIDVQVGKRLREFREARKLSQTDLAGALGITFQQVQKYENGHNRVSASRLHDAACFLKVPVSDFFEGLDDIAPEGLSESEARIWAFTRTSEGQTLSRYFSQLSTPVRRSVVSVVKALLAEQKE